MGRIRNLAFGGLVGLALLGCNHNKEDVQAVKEARTALKEFEALDSEGVKPSYPGDFKGLIGNDIISLKRDSRTELYIMDTEERSTFIFVDEGNDGIINGYAFARLAKRAREHGGSVDKLKSFYFNRDLLNKNKELSKSTQRTYNHTLSLIKLEKAKLKLKGK